MTNTGRRKFDIIEVALLVGLASFIAFAFGITRTRWTTAPELPMYAEKYGPERNSMGGEEWLIRDYFQDKRNGVFVDVGANHYKNLNNTYFLEAHLSWSGLAVEPLQEFASEYAKFRPRTKFVPVFVSDVSNEQAKIFVPQGRSVVTSSDRAFAERHGRGFEVKEVSAPTITLNDLLDGAGIKAFDFLSIDIELAEPKALAGFDIKRFRPALVCIEAHREVRQSILTYFAKHGYVLIGNYLKADDSNLYFAPLEQLAS